MDVSFEVVPHFMPGLEIQDFLDEVQLHRDTIYLDSGARAVEESRLTGWQSDIGATFIYSGKEMRPQQRHAVRDRLTELTGVCYDSVLINYYHDGRCGMRFHSDPLYDRWTPNTCVVSIGETRTFVFRETSDFSVRWQYPISNGDVVIMHGDCQDRFQHCIKVERDDRGAAEMAPRVSLVFKQRIRDPQTGLYL
ncbi:MAG: hypothetical protein WDW38_007617 [Sanguina aurantia]